MYVLYSVPVRPMVGPVGPVEPRTDNFTGSLTGPIFKTLVKFYYSESKSLYLINFLLWVQLDVGLQILLLSSLILCFLINLLKITCYLHQFLEL